MNHHSFGISHKDASLSRPVPYIWDTFLSDNHLDMSFAHFQKALVRLPFSFPQQPAL